MTQMMNAVTASVTAGVSAAWSCSWRAWAAEEPKSGTVMTGVLSCGCHACDMGEHSTGGQGRSPWPPVTSPSRSPRAGILQGPRRLSALKGRVLQSEDAPQVVLGLGHGCLQGCGDPGGGLLGYFADGGLDVILERDQDR